MDVKNRLVKKSNTAISSRVKGYSLNQMKIMNLAISELTEHTTADEVLSFQAVDLLKAIGLGENNHTELRKSTLDMIRGIEIPKADGGFSQVPVFHEIEYHTGGTVDIRFHEKVLPLLVQAKTEYTKYYFQNIQRLKSGYSIKIYELCKQYQNTKQGYRDLTIDELKIYLDIPLKKYPRFSNFKQKILNVAIPEISEKTDIKLDIEPIKKGRSVAGIRFYISLKNREQQAEEEQPTLPHDFKELTPAGRQLVDDYLMSPKIAVELQILAKSDDVLFYAMAELNKKMDRAKSTIQNKARYTETALRESLPILLISGKIEKEKIKAEEKKKQAELQQQKKQAEEKANISKTALEKEFKAFCNRSDLLEVLQGADLKNLLSTELSKENEFLVKQAEKEAQNIYVKSVKTLSPNDVFEVLTDNAKGMSFTASKPIQYRTLKMYLKNVLGPLF
jgi:plasmid replication initiation protein